MTLKVTCCDICSKELDEMYCTRNVCKECCENELCPIRSWCKAYPRVERLMKKNEWNPSERTQ